MDVEVSKEKQITINHKMGWSREPHLILDEMESKAVHEDEEGDR